VYTYIYIYSHLLEILEERHLLRQQKQQRLALPPRARRAPHPVDVRLWLVGRVVLHDPVDRGDVEPARSDVCAEQDPRLGGAELEEGGGALVLLLVAVQVEHGEVDVVEELRVVFHRVARREED